MTKLRAPDSVEDAVMQCIALIGVGVISETLSPPGGPAVSESLVTKWADPEAPQRIALSQALRLEILVIKTGNEPIFLELFKKLLPTPVQAAVEPSDPLREAMRAAVRTTELMQAVDRATLDGRIDRGEWSAIEKVTHEAQQQIARVRRVVRALIDRPRPSKVGRAK